MIMKVGPLDYNKLGRQPIERLKDGFRDKKGLEEIMDCEIGPDVRYVLSKNDIDLVKRYLRSPITPAEFRELSFKLRELLIQEVWHIKKSKVWNSNEESSDKVKSKGATETTLYNDSGQGLVDLVA